LPDFSHAGYKGGGVDLPEVSTVRTISPITGDNTKHIQDAIDYVGSLPKNSDGIRGALLLEAGKYDIYGSLYVKYDGVVLRGVGDGDDPANSTIIYARGNTPAQRTVVTLGNTSQINGIKQISNTLSNITDDVVEVGSFTFSVANPALYAVGDRIVIYHPATQAWVDAVDKGGVPYPDPSAPTDPDERWKAGQLPILFHRYIRQIDGNQITVDAPVFYSLNKSLSQCYIYKPNMAGLIDQVALENLRIDIETLGGTDENHAWQAARFKSCENAWAKNCTFTHFGQSGIITEACYRSTFIQCNAIDPVAIITGERMYNFNTYVHSQLNLFSHCYANNGRHHYVSNGTSTTSGNVFLRCVSDATNSVNEGHRQWTQGMLYDNYKEINLKRDFVLGLYNRVAMGTGHGWAAVHSVLWNCDVTASYGKIGLQKPPTAQNYAIGCFAKTITGNPINASNFTRGYVEGQNTAGLFPESIYEAQLYARKHVSSVSTHVVVPKKLKISPTIVGDNIHIKLGNNMLDTLLTIRDISGKIMAQKTTNNHECEMQTAHLQTGVYLLECRNNDIVESIKFIKQ
ncbi:MAG: T9SS type A sorting domain-containing protein, partial [Paludibacter sp.]|nr:T9SS type A sorting domain-containing protein [Paludibacter sp.]